jgi:hypothetical protein
MVFSFDRLKTKIKLTLACPSLAKDFVKDYHELIKDTSGTRDLSSLGIEFTIFLLVIALVLVPIGVKTYLNTNKTDVGITSGSTLETIFDNIVPIMFVVLILAVIYMVKRGD